MILEQQVSLESARVMYARIRRGAGAVSPGHVARLGESGLRALGVTRQKASYCHGIAVSIERGELDLSAIARLSEQEGREALLSIRGIGPWTADVYRLTALRHPDVWPPGDVALADAMHRVKRLKARPDHETQLRVSAAWAPWRAVAARMLWHYYLSTAGRA